MVMGHKRVVILLSSAPPRCAMSCHAKFDTKRRPLLWCGGNRGRECYVYAGDLYAGDSRRLRTQTMRMVLPGNSPAESAPVRRALAQNMVALRAARGWSQEDLAHAANVHRTFVTQVETQTRNLTLDNLAKLANALGVRADELLQPPAPQ